MHRMCAWLYLVFVASTSAPALAAEGQSISKDALVMVVTDPLSAKIACDCVGGYAQRDYERLGKYLQSAIGRPVVVVESESLAVAVKEKSNGRADIVIGKDSVVRHDAVQLKLPELEPALSLTDLQGSTKQKGLFVVRATSSVASLLDLENHAILFGPEKCEEKWAAAKAALQELEVSVAKSSTSCGTCSLAAKELVALPPDSRSAAVISSYAIPLLEGCGTVKKGELRVVGETGSVPFITCFISTTLSDSQRKAIRHGLQSIKDEGLLKALESKSGFVSYQAQ